MRGTSRQRGFSGASAHPFVDCNLAGVRVGTLSDIERHSDFPAIGMDVEGHAGPGRLDRPVIRATPCISEAQLAFAEIAAYREK